MIKVGDKLKRKIKVYDPSVGGAMTTTTVDAVVEYIHPEKRFYTVRCFLPGGRSFCDTEYFPPDKSN